MTIELALTEFCEFCNKNKILRESYKYLVIAAASTFLKLGQLLMKPCILLIEDDQDMRDLVAGHLEHSGFDVQKAEDGIKGQALALQYAPDLILLDLMLPKVDGLTLCDRL